jgi:CHASE3 domain sensor protein
MNFLLGLIIGFGLGAISLFLFQRQKLEQTKQKLKETRIALDQSEALNKQYEDQLQKLEQSDRSQLQELEQFLDLE